MPIRSILQEVKEEIGNISKGFKPRSHRSAAPAAQLPSPLNASPWADIPVELLREVLARIEESESSWPERKSVVSCAGVCKSWREIVTELVKKPEISGALSFPISLKQAGPREGFVQCFIRRDRWKQTYHLYLGLTRALSDNGKFLLAASRIRRLTCTDYIISFNPRNISDDNDTYAGKLRSNFLGTKFVVYDAMAPHAEATTVQSQSSRPGRRQVSPRAPSGNFPVAHVDYEFNILNSSGPRKMQCTMDSIPLASIKEGALPRSQSLLPPDSPLSTLLFHSKSSMDKTFPPTPPMAGEELLVLENKSPRWHEQLQCWCLNFRGRVTVASIKNFQLVKSSPEGGCGGENILLQFGKVGKDLFTMDYQYPLSAFQAFAICLSSFDTKIACK